MVSVGLVSHAFSLAPPASSGTHGSDTWREPPKTKAGIPASLPLASLEPHTHTHTPPPLPLQAVLDRCAVALGVPAASLSLYQLVEIPAGQQHVPSDCRHVAVSVEGSSFSLEALEGLLSERRRHEQQAHQGREALNRAAEEAQREAEAALKVRVLACPLHPVGLLRKEREEQCGVEWRARSSSPAGTPSFLPGTVVAGPGPRHRAGARAAADA